MSAPASVRFARAGSVVHPFTDDEDDLIREHSDWSAARLAEALDRTPRSVYQRRDLLAAHGESRLTYWTEDEDAFVLATPVMTASQVARHLGRTTLGVRKRRSKLGQIHGVSFGSRSGKQPNWIGKRRLLAKTCTKCGQLRSARWYRIKQGGYLGSECLICRPADPPRKGRENDTDASARQARRREYYRALTEPCAVNSGKEWTGPDLEILANPDLTRLEKALATGRTYNAIAVACTRNGYTSRKMNGLDVPGQGQWIIENPNLGRTA